MNNYLTGLKVLFLLIPILSASTFAQTFEVSLPQGKFEVGYKSFWKYDYSRTLNISEVDSSFQSNEIPARPVLIYIWYPSKPRRNSRKVKYGDYLTAGVSGEVSEKFRKRYELYNKEVAVGEILSKKETELNPEEKAQFIKILSTPTQASDNLPPLAGKFPIVFHHQGNRASMDDNILMCEFLASHGFVVIGSSYFKEEGSTLGIDGKIGSVRDISFILANIQNWQSNADIKNVALIGHSAGAQAAHIAMVQQSLNIKAMISLETTQEYHSLEMPLWKGFMNPVLMNIDQARGELLFLANPGALFQLEDTMKTANRYYYTIPKVGHNDFISQGIVKNYAQKSLQQNKKTQEKFTKVANDYLSINKLILAFLNDKLKGEKNGFAAYIKTTECNENVEPCLELMPPGKMETNPYKTSPIPPTVRQFRQMLKNTFPSAIAFLKNSNLEKDSILVNRQVAHALLFEMTKTNKMQDAKVLYNTYKNLLGEKFITDFKATCEFWEKIQPEPETYGIKCKDKIDFFDQK